MYRQHFGLREKPFRVVPSPRFLFASETHDENRARILYGIREDRGFVVVSGGIGLGKTTVLLAVLDRLGDDVCTALIFNPVDDFRQLLRMICHEFDIEPGDQDEVELMRTLNLFLVERLARGQRCVLMIDEAQNLPIGVLEKIRTLSNLQTEELSLLQIVLVGQPELRDKLDDPRLVQLRQRIGVWHDLSPLTREETRSYIWHRLRLAGAPMAEKVIVDEACHRAYDICGGIPRLINQVCDTALVIAYGQDEQSVQPRHVTEAGRELQLVGEEPTHDSRSTRRAAPSLPRLRVRGRVVRAAVVVAALALILSGAITHDDWWPWVSDRLAQPVHDVGSSTAAVSGSEEVAATATPLDAGRLQRVRERRDAVDQLRREGRAVFSVHLASFRASQEARSFVMDLMREHTRLEEPVFIETTDGNKPWYRVLAGGFANRDAAQDWMRNLRQGEGIQFAKLDRLSRSAMAVELDDPGSGVEEATDEQHS